MNLTSLAAAAVVDGSRRLPGRASKVAAHHQVPPHAPHATQEGRACDE